VGIFGKCIIAKRLLHLNGLSGVNEFVYVSRHGSSQDIVGHVEVRTLVIPAAGLGTRFLPATKAVPKELMPIGDTPAIQLVIDEALGAGIDHVVLVGSRAKPALEQYFAARPDLEHMLRAKGDEAMADRLASIGRDWRVSVVHQDDPKGLGHAVGCASGVVDGDAFVVSLPDEIMGGSQFLQKMIDVCTTTSGSVVGLMEVERSEVSAYGVVAPEAEMVDGVVKIGDLVEKPAIDEAPSSLIIIGRYVLTVDIFEKIAQLTPGAGGELQLTDAIRAQAPRSPLHGVETMVNRWDTGTPAGFLTAAVEMALLGDGVEGLDGDLRNIVERHRS
jgi:UTP--glucose-1-phosphate uridylyltransferase